MPPKPKAKPQSPLLAVRADQGIRDGFENILNSTVEKGKATLKEIDFENVMDFSLEEVRSALEKVNAIWRDAFNSFGTEEWANIFIKQNYPITATLCQKIMPYLRTLINKDYGLRQIPFWNLLRRYRKSTIRENFKIRGQVIGILSLTMLNAIIIKDESVLKEVVATFASAHFLPYMTPSGLKKHLNKICEKFEISTAGTRIGTLQERLKAINREQQQYYKYQKEIIVLEEQYKELQKKSGEDAFISLGNELKTITIQLHEAEESYKELYKKYYARLTPSEQTLTKLTLETAKLAVESRDIVDQDDDGAGVGVDSTPFPPVSQHQVKEPFHTTPEGSRQGNLSGVSNLSTSFSYQATSSSSSASSSSASVSKGKKVLSSVPDTVSTASAYSINSQPSDGSNNSPASTTNKK